MPAFAIRAFAGVIPRTAAHLLADGQAQVAFNVVLRDGRLTPLREPLHQAYLGRKSVRTVFRMEKDGASYWLSWIRDVSVARGPIPGDTTQRIYWTGDGEPRVSNFDLVTTGGSPYPQAWYVMGVFPPANAPGVSHAGGTGAAVSRAFQYTFVAVWPDGNTEESKPSPASALTAGKVDGTWTITGMDTAPPNSYSVTSASWSGGVLTLTCANTFGLRPGEEVALSGFSPSIINGSWAVNSVGAPGFTIVMSDPGTITDGIGTAARLAPHNTASMIKRLYWTESGEYVLIQENIPVANTGTTVAGGATALGALLSDEWEMPPTDMIAVLRHPSGFMVGLSKNELCFSEPLRPYAWPAKYRQTLESRGIGLGLFGSTIVVATEGAPEMASGVVPESVSLTKGAQPWPCVAARGVAPTGSGVMFPTHAGILFGGPAGFEVATAGIYTQRDFSKVQPDTLIAAVHDGAYYGLYNPTPGISRILIFKPSEAASLIEASHPITSLYCDDLDGQLYCVAAGSTEDAVLLWDGDDGLNLAMDWMSKELWFQKPWNPGAAKVDAVWEMSAEQVAAAQTAYNAALAANEALVAGWCGGSMNDDDLNAVRLAGSAIDLLPPLTFDSMQFTLYVSGAAKFSKQVKSNNPFRLPSGYKADKMAVRITGNVVVKSVAVAGSVAELGAV